MQKSVNQVVALLAILLVTTLSHGKCFPCQQDDLVDYLDREVAAVAMVSSPAEISRYIEESNAFTDKRWKKAWELATDEKFGFARKERIEETSKLLAEAVAVLSRVNEIGVVLHDIENWDITIILHAKPSVQAELIEWFTKLSNHILNADLPVTEVGVEQASRNPTKAFIESERDWLIVSSSVQRGTEIVKRMSGSDKTRSLSQSRRYQRIKSLLSTIRNSNCPITVYGSPEKLSSLFFPDLSPKEREAYQFDEIPSVGFQVSFFANDGKFEPAILIDAGATFTQPHSGITKVLDAYTPLQPLPIIPFPVTDLIASSFDPMERHMAFREIQDAANGVGSYEDTMQKSVDILELDYREDVIAKSDCEIGFHYAVLSRYGYYGRLKMEHVRDTNAAQRYIDAVVRRGNTSTGSTLLRKRKNDFGDLFSTAPTSGQNDNSQARKGGQDFSALHFKPAFFRNDDWLLTGRHQGIVELLDSIYGNDSQSCDAQNAIEKIVRNEKTFFVQYGSMWALRPSQFEDKRIQEKHKNDRFKAYEVKIRKPNEFGFRLDVESKADSKAVFLSLIGSSIGDGLGSYAFGCAKDDEKMWLRCGLFPKIMHPFSGN